MTAVPYWCGREHVGRYLATLFLDEYKIPSLEDVTSLFDDKWMRESLQKTIERLDAIIALFEMIKERLLHYCQLCRLSFFSDYFHNDNFLPKTNASLIFFKCLSGNYPLPQYEISYYRDQVSYTILFNNVKHERIVEVCDLLEKVSLHLQEKRSIFELKKTQQCKKADENVDDHICEALDCCFKVYYDEVDYL